MKICDPPNQTNNTLTFYLTTDSAEIRIASNCLGWLEEAEFRLLENFKELDGYKDDADDEFLKEMFEDWKLNHPDWTAPSLKWGEFVLSNHLQKIE